MMSGQLIIITGLSGAGKSMTLKTFEDMGYYCIDNLPLQLLPNLLEKKISEKLALVMDGRDPSFPANPPDFFIELKNRFSSLHMLYLEADNTTLLRRFSQARRGHPLAGPDTDTVQQGIETERKLLHSVRQQADKILDTSDLSPWDLRRLLHEEYGDSQLKTMRVHLISFGFKNGLPEEADMIWDVRFLPNPYWEPELKEKNGLNDQVASFVMDNKTAQQFLDCITPLLSFLIPQFEKEGKAHLTIAIGCTGGRHRSVAVSRAIQDILKTEGIQLSLSHRDIGRD